ncbi:MAG: hypothetical protein WA906_13445, partial [Pacificimonas sp.]
PLISQTIAELMPSRTPEEQRRLRALANMEIQLYARHAAGRGALPTTDMVKALYYPEGLAALPKIAAYAAMAPVRGARLRTAEAR